MSKIPDISHYHPVTDWTAVQSECPLLISKATQGTGYVDSTLESFVSGCESYGIPYWLYAYLNDGNELEQVYHLIDTCSGLVGPYFRGYALDVEDGNSASGVQEALTYLEAQGGRCMLYTMYSSYSTYKSVITGRSSATAWWEARYGKNDGTYSSSYPCHDGADLHQYTSAGTCSGISGSCDLNRLTGNKAQAWFTEAEASTETEDDIVTVEQFSEMMGEYRETLQDNDAGSWSEEARTWATSTGLVEGNGTTVDGEENCMWQDFLTREQLVTVLYRFANQHGLL